jgi:hypothetical protein
VPELATSFPNNPINPSSPNNPNNPNHRKHTFSNLDNPNNPINPNNHNNPHNPSKINASILTNADNPHTLLELGAPELLDASPVAVGWIYSLGLLYYIRLKRFIKNY